MPMRFRDRAHAGRALADRLRQYARRENVLVLALPRGGVPVAYEVAAALDAPLDIFLVRKIGLPGHEEFAIGAIATGGVRVLNEEVLESIGLGERELEVLTQRERAELERRERAYRGDRPPPDVAGKVVILVDDGLATGSTMRAAVEALRLEEPSQIIVAVPTAAAETCEELGELVDDVVCASTPEPFLAVGLWYDDFSQTTDDEVRELLAARRSAGAGGAPPVEWRPGGA